MPKAEVVLLRSSSESDPYLQAFSEVGLTASCESVLQFSFPRQSVLRDRLRRPDALGGLVLTSPRAARAVHRVFRSEPSLQGEWEGRPAYVVGPKTGSWMDKLGFAVRGEEAGSASALAQRIAEEDPARRVLFLSGNRRRDVLPEALQEAEVTFDELVVYETHYRTDLELPSPSENPWLVFFSPSGIEAVQNAGIQHSAYRLAAIGSTTATALREAGSEVEAVAASPTPAALVDAIRKAEEGERKSD